VYSLIIISGLRDVTIVSSGGIGRSAHDVDSSTNFMDMFIVFVATVLSFGLLGCSFSRGEVPVE
jgi:hypothetical protein